MKAGLAAVALGVFLGVAPGSAAVDAGLRATLDRRGAATLRPWATLSGPSASGGLAARRGRTEEGGPPHVAAWLQAERPGGQRWRMGCWSFEDPSGALLGAPRPRPFGGPLRVELRARPGSAAGWRAEESGLGWQRDGRSWQAGAWVSRTRRDRRADGEGFVLDLERSERNAGRVGAWTDDLELAWLQGRSPAGVQVLVLGGLRRAPLHGGPFAGLVLGGAVGQGRAALALAAGRHRLARLQWSRRLPAAASLRLEGWGGRRGEDPWSDPPLPLGPELSGGGDAVLEGRIARWRLAARLRRLWAGAVEDAGVHWERRLRAGRDWSLPRRVRLRLTGDWTRSGQGPTAPEDRWLLQAALRPATGLELTVQRRGLQGPEGGGRATGLRLDARARSGSGLRLQWLRHEGGRSTPLSRLPWPGSGWSLSGRDGRQTLGVGGWLAHKGWRLALSVDRRWTPPSEPSSPGAWSCRTELRYRSPKR